MVRCEMWAAVFFGLSCGVGAGARYKAVESDTEVIGDSLCLIKAGGCVVPAGDDAVSNANRPLQSGDGHVALLTQGADIVDNQHFTFFFPLEID